MRDDELIDKVAARMTVLDGRPALQARVAAAIAGPPRHARYLWLVPVAAAAAVVLPVAAWLLLPASTGTGDTPVVVAERSATVRPTTSPSPAEAGMNDGAAAIPDAVEPPRVREVAAASPVPAAAMSASAAPAPVEYWEQWTEGATQDVPMLPPLAGPPPIEIEPVAWEDVTIAPLTVELIEIEALVVEPLVPAEISGV